MEHSVLEHVIQFIIQFVTVALGVALGLCFDRWKERRKNKAFLERAFEVIKREINDNIREIENFKEPLTKELGEKDLKNLEPYLDDNTKTLADIIHTFFGEKGVKLFPNIKNIGMRYFIAKHAELVNIKVLFYFSCIENLLHFIEEEKRQMIDHIYRAWPSNSSIDKKIFKQFITDIINNMGKLLRLYEEFIKKDFSTPEDFLTPSSTLENKDIPCTSKEKSGSNESK